METNVQITLIIAAAIIVLVTLLLNRGRLKRLIIKGGNEGVEVGVEMTETSDATKPEDGSTGKSKAVIERVRQKGKDDDIRIDAKDVKATDIEQTGNGNKINIG